VPAPVGSFRQKLSKLPKQLLCGEWWLDNLAILFRAIELVDSQNIMSMKEYMSPVTPLALLDM
jgi:hypothetical protein